MLARLVFAFAIGALPSGRAPGDEPAVDLRGPDPKVGLKLRVVTRTDMRGADVTLKNGSQTLSLKVDAVGVEEEEVVIKAVDGRAVTQLTTRVLRDETTRTVNANGNKETSEEVGDLAGQVIVSTKGKGGWTHKLAEGEPNKDQAKALANRSPYDDDDEIPAGKQKIGAEWEWDGTHFKKFCGPDCTAASGKVRCTFTGLQKVNGELCAVIQSAGTLKVKLKSDDGEKVGTLELNMTECRSLKHGVSLKAEGDLIIKTSGKEKVDGMEVDVTLSAKLRLTMTTEVRN